MNITAIKHYDEFLGWGYYLLSEYMDKTWYRGNTPEEAVDHFKKDKGLEQERVKLVCIRHM